MLPVAAFFGAIMQGLVFLLFVIVMVGLLSITIIILRFFAWIVLCLVGILTSPFHKPQQEVEQPTEDRRTIFEDTRKG